VEKWDCIFIDSGYYLGMKKLWAMSRSFVLVASLLVLLGLTVMGRVERKAHATFLFEKKNAILASSQESSLIRSPIVENHKDFMIVGCGGFL